MKYLWAIFVVVALGCAAKVKPLRSTAPQPGPAPLVIFVGGEFRQPGRFPWRNGMTASDAIQLAGGFNNMVSIRSLEIHHWDGSREVYPLTSDLRLKQDVPLKPGDQIINFKW
jgi:protein involved in polysaccharide export with SLBB domain